MRLFKNIFFSNKFKHFTIIAFLLFVFVMVNAWSYVSAVSSNISNNVFRLHVIANSDSDEDQSLKYIVRDAVIDYVRSSTSSATCKEELIQMLDLYKIKDVAYNTVLANGYSYPVSVELGNFEFPTKTYGDISLPSGFYDALRVKIGSASGKNWWCVMFPPLCFVDESVAVVDADGKEMLKENLSKEEYEALFANGNVEAKSKVLEWIKEWKR